MGVVVGILRQPAGGESFTDVLIKRGLHEGVQVLLTLAAPPHIVDDGSRDAASRVVDVGLRLPASLIQFAEEVGLQALGVDITVLAHGRGVPGSLPVGVAALVAELILAAGRQEAGTHRRTDLFRQPLLPEHRCTQHVARSVLRLYLQVGLFPRSKFRCLRPDVDGSRIAKVGGRLEDGTLLAVVERDLLHVVERELPQVYLSVLRVAQLHAVVRDAQVVGAHRTDVHRLDTTHAAVVLQLDAREVAQGIGHRERVQPFQLLTVELLAWHHLAHGGARHDHYLPHTLYGIQLALSRHRHAQAASKGYSPVSTIHYSLPTIHYSL